MSYVTNVMISGLFYESDNVKSILDNYSEINGCKVGGTKCLECDLFIGAFNYIDPLKLINQLADIEKIVEPYEWENTQVFIKNDNDDIWYVHLASEITESDIR